MKEILKGWIARDKGANQTTSFLSDEPSLSLGGIWWAYYPPIKFEIEKHHGLKPGQIKKAKITVEVE